MQNLVVASNKQSLLNPQGFLLHLMPIFLTPSPTVENPERHWHTGDTDVDESDSDESESEHREDTDVGRADLYETGKGDPDDNSLEESDSGKKTRMKTNTRTIT